MGVSQAFMDIHRVSIPMVRSWWLHVLHSAFMIMYALSWWSLKTPIGRS